MLLRDCHHPLAHRGDPCAGGHTSGGNAYPLPFSPRSRGRFGKAENIFPGGEGPAGWGRGETWSAVTAARLQEALCSTPGAALTPAGPPEHPAGRRRGAAPPARTATPCCHLPPAASAALPASQKPAPRGALGEVIPPPLEAAPRPLVPFVLRPAVEIRVLCAYSPFCIVIISLYNFPFLLLLFYFIFFTAAFYLEKD